MTVARVNRAKDGRPCSESATLTDTFVPFGQLGAGVRACLAASMHLNSPPEGPTRKRNKIMTDSQRTEFPAFTEHRVPRDRGSLYVRDFPGSGPAFVLLHGFPDNSHIYDDLIPHLTSAGAEPFR
jgi:hypothetical protein